MLTKFIFDKEKRKIHSRGEEKVLRMESKPYIKQNTFLENSWTKIISQAFIKSAFCKIEVKRFPYLFLNISIKCNIWNFWFWYQNSHFVAMSTWQFDTKFIFDQGKLERWNYTFPFSRTGILSNLIFH